MKFRAKVFFCTIIVIALAMGLGGYFLIKINFDAAIDREMAQALDESAVICFTFETIALNIPLKYETLQDETIGEIAASLETGRFIRISGENGNAPYSSPVFIDADGIPDGVADADSAICKIIKNRNVRYVYAAFPFNTVGRALYLETAKDVTAIFEERDRSVEIYRRITIATIIAGAFFMYFISLWLTRPIRALAGAAREMASGNYSRRAPYAGTDELGLLTGDFNTMADSLQDKMIELREEAAARVRFMSAFSHELKTPLTSIIGYADALRSYRLGDEETVMSADYIYKEGKRLEEMSLRLLEIIVLRKNALTLTDTPVSVVLDPLSDMFGIAGNVKFTYDEAVIQAETSLLKTVLVNLIDNAIKYSGKDRPILVKGRSTGRGYMFTIVDKGIGIDAAEIGKITQAFYMVDKSRSRSSGGSGLGLTLCVEILSLFGSELIIESKVSAGTRASFVLPPQTLNTDGGWRERKPAVRRERRAGFI